MSNSEVQKLDNFRQRKVKLENFYGKRSRATNVCSNCRRIKKKCDGTYPSCQRCLQFGYVCCWNKVPVLRKAKAPQLKKPLITADKEGRSNLAVEERDIAIFSGTVNSEPINLEILVANQVGSFSGILKLYSDIESQDEFHSENEGEGLMEPYFTRLQYPNRLNFMPGLDEFGAQCLLYFQERVSKSITICPDKYNYLLNVLMPLASFSNSIQLALAAFGCLFLGEKSNKRNHKFYLKSATREIMSLYKSPEKMTNADFYIVMSFNMILLGLEICSGDTFYAPLFLEWSKSLIQKRGGISKVIEDFDSSNDIKWLLSNIQYHDVLSSETALRGCLFLKYYDEVFEQQNLLDSVNYGIDPFQGAMQPMYLLIGNMMTESAKIKEEWGLLEVESNVLLNEKMSVLAQSSKKLNVTASRKEKLFDKVEQISFKFAQKINNCRPNKNQFSLLLKEENILELHLSLYKLFEYCATLYLNNNIKRIPPSSFEQSRLLCKALPVMGELVSTRMVTCMAFPILICGMQCATNADRLTMIQIMERYMIHYNTMNTLWINNIIEDSWLKNPEGNLCLDWVDIVKEKNWLVFLA